ASCRPFRSCCSVDRFHTLGNSCVDIPVGKNPDRMGLCSLLVSLYGFSDRALWCPACQLLLLFCSKSNFSRFSRGGLGYYANQRNLPCAPLIDDKGTSPNVLPCSSTGECVNNSCDAVCYSDDLEKSVNTVDI